MPEIIWLLDCVLSSFLSLFVCVEIGGIASGSPDLPFFMVFAGIWHQERRVVSTGLWGTDLPTASDSAMARVQGALCPDMAR